MLRSRIAFFVLASFLVALLPQATLAQDGFGTITGLVMDSDDAPISGITVRAVDALDPTRFYSSITDHSGSFSLARVPVGTYHVFPRTAQTSWII